MSLAIILHAIIYPFNHLPTENFHAFVSSADDFFFSKSFFFENSFRNTIRVSNSLDPDQARRFVGSDLGPNCLQKLIADDTSRQRVKRPLIQTCNDRVEAYHRVHRAFAIVNLG